MNKGLRKFLILLIIFVAALFGFSRFTNHETKDLTADMKDATLPVVYFVQNDSRVNELHGYAQEMRAVSMRDTITPVSRENGLSIQVDTYKKKIDSISFEIRSLDTERLVQDAEAKVLSSSETEVQAQLPVADLLENDREYLLILKLQSGSDSYYYYTRVILESDSHIQECMDFVNTFHDITMDRERQAELAPYMEPSATGDNSTLQKVTINSSLSQACWADLEGQEVTEPMVSVKEIQDTYHVFTVNYIMASVGEDQASEYYNVEEYYRIRWSKEKIYLLDFERTTEEIFRSEGENIREDYIDLGIRSAEVDFKANETGNIICFVQQGELWCYQLDENELTQVFSFRSQEGMDVRENYDEHDIRIIRTDEGGSMDFVVYGYMNRGEHEGKVGVSVCHYDGVTNTVEELLFLPSDTSYQVLKEEIGKLMYLSDDGSFYLTMGEQVHKINLETKEAAVMVDDLSAGVYESSDNGRYLAWTQSSQEDTMHVTDLETGAAFEIKAEAGEMVKPLGFIGTDCIYGIGKKTDKIGDAGQASYLVSQVNIMDTVDSAHSILKTYESRGAYVTDAEVKDGSIYLNRVKKKGSGYVETSQDTIRNRDMQEPDVVYVSTQKDTVKQQEVILQLSREVSSSDPKVPVSKLILPEKSTTLELEPKESGNMYYVYAKGKVMDASSDVAQAISSAYSYGGVVTDENQSYVWKRSKKQIQQPLAVKGAEGSGSQEKALSAVIAMAGGSADVREQLTKGDSPYEILKEAVTERHTYDLTGCSLEQILYYVSLGTPVYAGQGGDSAVLITGYDDLYVWIYDPGIGRAYSRLLKTASAEFEEDGNVFYCVGE